MKRNLLLVSVLWFATIPTVFGAVEVQRLPAGAMQPLAITDDTGAVHLVWLQGEPKACDVFYQRLPGGRTNGTAPIRVNSQPGSAIGIGTIRGAQLAVGRHGRVHVAWNGSSKAEPKPAEGSPLLYARIDDFGRAFEPQRNLLGKTALLDGGASVASDRLGNVYVVWHAAPSADQTDETARRVYLARSSDDGASFQPEKSISLTNGVCGCCSLRAYADRTGRLLLLYRAATSPTDRHITLLSSSDQGLIFRQVLTDPWSTGMCPMSSAALVDGPRGVFASWETKGQVQTAIIQPNLPERFATASESSGDRGKHPALAVNAQGDALSVWAEGTGWQKGGSVGWRLLDSKGTPMGENATRAGLPVWSFPAAFARDDGQFIIVF